MDNLRDRFAALDRVPMPDLWSDVEQRAARLRSAERPTSVTVRTPARSLGGRDRAPALLAAVALLVVLLAGVVAVGSGLVKLPAILPVPAVSPSPNSSLTPEPTGTPAVEPIPSDTPVVGPNGLVAYSVCNRPDPENGSFCDGDVRVWVVNADGTGAHELRPDERGSQYPIAWSPDGSKLLYSSDEWGDDLAMTDAAGSAPEVLPNESLCPVGARDCYASLSKISFSPDGSRLAYAIFTDADASDSPCRAGGCELGDGTIAVFEIATGKVTSLNSSRIPGPLQCCDAYYAPSWSADGRRLAFAMPVLTSFTIGVDGSDLRQLTPAGQYGTAPLWSPDGSAIASTVCGTEPAIYLAQPDGGNLRTVVADACDPQWTVDGRIVFSRSVADQPVSTWIIDTDGGNERRLDDTIPALTAAGCMVCAYRDEDGNVTGMALWQPVKENQP